MSKDLHDEIMNLPSPRADDYDEYPNEKMAYKIGHRDARHAAANLALAAAPQVVADERAAQTELNEIADLFSIGSEARKQPGTIITNVRNTIKFANLLHAVEREFFMSPDDENECLVNCWGSTTEQYLAAMRAALQAAPVQAQEPVLFFKQKCSAIWIETDSIAWLEKAAPELKDVFETRVLYRAPLQPVAVPDGLPSDPDDSLHLCISDLQHSGIYDSPREMAACIKAVTERMLAILAAPAAQGDAKGAHQLAIEEKAQEIYNTWMSQPEFVAWQPGGNSHMQERARDMARAAIAAKAES